MLFDEYQQKAWSFALTPSKTTQYLIPGIAGEVGELCSLFAKAVRDDNGLPAYDAVKKELGDVLWFVATIALYYGISLDEIAEANITKLQSRKDRNVINGSGDNR